MKSTVRLIYALAYGALSVVGMDAMLRALSAPDGLTGYVCGAFSFLAGMHLVWTFLNQAEDL